MPAEDINKVFILGASIQDTPYHVFNFLGKDQGPILACFLEQASRALRVEVSSLPSTLGAQIAPFSDIQALCALEHQKKLHPSLQSSLTCISELAYVISLFEGDQGSFPAATETLVVGLDVGALAAAAICTSRNLTQLLKASIEVVRLTFRVAITALEVSRTIDPSSESGTLPWTILISGISFDKASAIITEFSAAKIGSSVSRPYISTVGVNSVSISGPPGVLEELKSFPALQSFKTAYESVYAAYHAPHLYSKKDVAQIISGANEKNFLAYTKNLDFLSPVNGTLSWSQTFRSLAEEAVASILLEPVREDAVAQRLESWMGSLGSTLVQMHSINSRSLLAGPYESTHQATASNPAGVGSQPISRSKIAIVGFSGRFPEADSLSEYWNLLCEGLDVHKVVPPRRWNTETHVDITGKSKNTSATPYGCWLDNAGLFDAKFFHLSPREAPQVDPAQRLALMTAYEAIEQAGIVPGNTPSTKKDRVGVFYGVTSNDWMETNSSQNIDTYMIPGGNRAFIPGRVNYFFKFSGPSYSIDTACSSSLASMHAACNALWRGDVDTAIAGGTNVLTNPDFTAGLDRGHFLSRTGNCRSFDDSADGYCRGEGVVTLILKRYEDAVADGNPIHGLILSAYTNHSADAESITRPHGGAQKAIFNKLLYNTGTNPYDISYVEMHGTGTQAGDAEEMRSVLDVFAPEKAFPIRSDEQALYLGSVKANIGHGEAASGVSSLAKVLLMMKHDTIPPHCGVKTKLNTKFPSYMSGHNVRIANKPTAWPRPSNGRTRKVFVNNFSAAGGNSALIMEDAPIAAPLADEKTDARSHHVVAISAKSIKSLEGNIDSLLQHLESVATSKLTLPTLSYTTTARRIHHMFRIMVSGSNLSDIKERLMAAKHKVSDVQRVKTETRPIFAFTGQGSQYPGMGKQLYQNLSSFRYDLDRYDQLAQQLGFPSFLQVITDDTQSIEDYPPVVSQLATTCLEMALGRLWESWGIMPRAVVGHSLGEYAALYIAGSLSESDTIHLVGSRAQLLEQHCTPNTHSMLAVKASLSAVQNLIIGSGCEIACLNGTESTVLSGDSRNIKQVQGILNSHGIKGTLLRVPYAFHSSQVDPILEEFTRVTSRVTVLAPKIPIICATNASIMKDSNTIDATYFAKHCREPVNMLGAIQKASQEGLVDERSIVIEVGPQPVVSKMVNASLQTTATLLPSLQQGQDTWKLIVSALMALYTQGAEINWREYHRDFQSSQRVIELPTYSWDLKDYWIQYTNDWSLYKGEAPKGAVSAPANSTTPASLQPAAASAQRQPIFQKLESTTIHKVLEEQIGPQTGKLVVEGDISRPDLNPLVQGHKVNGIPLCTPSVYAELALKIGTYLLERYQPTMAERLVTVTEMTIEKAFIAQISGSQILRTSVSVDWEQRSASVAYESYVDASRKPARHATCKIVFKDFAKERSRFAQKAVTVKQRMASLKKDLTEGNIYKFNRSMIYKMIGALAQFDSKYTGLKEIVLDSKALEAYGSAEFSNVNSVGEFYTHPAYIDAVSQIGGFVMNCNDNTNLDEEVFMNHGWNNFGLFEKLSKEKVYDLHVSMHETPGNKWQGDITIFDGASVVSFFEGITLQGVAKRALHYILAREKDLGGKATKPPNVTEAKAAVAAAPAHTRNSVAPSTTSVAAISINQVNQVPSSLPNGSHNVVLPPVQAATLNPPVVAATPSTAVNKTSKKVDLALQIISEESGIPVDEMTDSVEFSELGIDSLLILIIAGRFDEELGLLVDSTIFGSLPTIKAFKQFIIDSDPEASTVDKITTPSSFPETPQPQGGSPMVYGEVKFSPTPHAPAPAPAAAVAVVAPSPAATFTAALHEIQSPATAMASVTGSDDSKAFKEVLQIISEESGVAVEDLADDTYFGDVGVDSLLSLIIVGRLKEELSIDLEADNSLFVEFPTVKDIRIHFQGNGDDDSVAPARSELIPIPIPVPVPAFSSSPLSSTDMQGILSSPGSSISPTMQTPPSEMSSSHLLEKVNVRPASSIILQGKPRLDPETLFLLPDGGGSAASYARLPRIKSDLAVIGLNCPYVRHPEEMMTCSLEDLIDAYINEIRKRQPNGPYHVGGWSSGGILAYLATQRLIQEGEEVTHLVLIDSPPPQGLDRLPQSFYDFCGRVNLFDATKNQSASTNNVLPAELLAHFKSNIEVLHDYYAIPLPEGLTPITTIIYAPECVFDGVTFPKLPPGPDDTEGMKFLTEKRTDFTPGGWTDLFPGEEINVEIVQGATHFSMMGTYAESLAALIGKSLGSTADI